MRQLEYTLAGLLAGLSLVIILYCAFGMVFALRVMSYLTRCGG